MTSRNNKQNGIVVLRFCKKQIREWSQTFHRRPSVFEYKYLNPEYISKQTRVFDRFYECILQN